MSHAKKNLLQGIIAIIVIAIGVTGFIKLKAEKKELEKKAPKIPLPIVRTITVTNAPMQIIITGQGTVSPVNEIQMVPQVSGRVVGISPDLVNGGMFTKGEILLSIEPTDYEIAVTASKARVKEAESSFAQVTQDAAAAIAEWKSMNPDEDPPPLVAKKPQTASALAKLEAERANLKKAELNLARTRIMAPFNGRVASENVDTGQYVTPGQSMAVLYGTDTAQIVVPLEDQDLFWFDVPGFTTDTLSGALADVKAVVAGREVTWQGRVVRSEGRINNLSRMHNIVILVDTPYASFPPLAAGQFVEVRIHGKHIEHAAVIPRSAVHDGNIVWMIDMEKNRLLFRKIDIARTNHTGVVVQNGLDNGARIVISPLKVVSDGMKVRVMESGKGTLP